MGNPSAASEEELRASEEKFRTLIEGSVQGILVHDGALLVLFINQPGAEMLGFDSAEEALGVNLLDTIILPEDREASFAQFDRVIRTDQRDEDSITIF